MVVPCLACLEVETLKPGHSGDIQIFVHLQVLIDGRPVSIPASKPLRAHLGPLSPKKRQSVIATMPPQIDIRSRLVRGQIVYDLDQGDVRRWTEDARQQYERSWSAVS